MGSYLLHWESHHYRKKKTYSQAINASVRGDAVLGCSVRMYDHHILILDTKDIYLLITDILT